MNRSLTPAEINADVKPALFVVHLLPHGQILLLQSIQSIHQNHAIIRTIRVMNRVNAVGRAGPESRPA